MTNNWKPAIQKSDKPLYLALVRRMNEDIVNGSLTTGTRLPPQRELADELQVAIGTITRAYEEAERRGLVYGDGRRGTFVGERQKARGLLASLNRSASIGVDLSKNHPSAAFDPELSAVLREISRGSDRAQLLSYPPPAGLMLHREAGARWITELGLPADPQNVYVTAGAQNSILATFAAEARTGDIVVTEEYAYPGVKAVCDMLGLELLGVAIDDEGIVPEALETICRSKNVRVLYCNPSLQNPTNSVMPTGRRRQIAEIAEKYDISVVEDEILSPLLDDRPEFIASMIPQRCHFVVSTSKTVAAGLRIGFVVAPAGSQQKLSDNLQAISLGQPALMAEVFTRWYEDGTVARTIARRKVELARAQQEAQELLHGFDLRAHPSSYHCWLRLPENWTSLEFTREVQMRGVAVAPAEVFAVEPKSSINAVRLSLGSASSRELLKAGLTIVAETLAGSRRPDAATV